MDSDVVFVGASNTHSVNDSAAGTELNSLTFGPNASKFTLSGFNIFLAGGAVVANNSAALQVISFADGAGVGGITLNDFNFNSSTTISHGDVYRGQRRFAGDQQYLVRGTRSAHRQWLAQHHDQRRPRRRRRR
ncbi:MAG: hypothetical protein WDN28_28890 [Chthoniobacter sp.]